MGIHHIRDGFHPWPSSSPIVQAHKSPAAAGIMCNYVVPYALSTQPIAIEDFAPEVGDLEALEAPNECDVSGECGGNGGAAVSNVVAFLPTVHLAAADLKVPAVGPSFVVQAPYLLTGNLDSLINFNNLHIYFGGRNPGNAGWGDADSEGNSYGSFSWWLDQAAIDGPGLPSEITETGCIAFPTTTTSTRCRKVLKRPTHRARCCWRTTMASRGPFESRYRMLPASGRRVNDKPGGLATRDLTWS